MKVLTLTQPWASLVADGRKTIETRSWPVAFRGPLAIHAAKGWTKADREFAFECGYDPGKLPLGAILCIADLVACGPTEKVPDVLLTEDEERFGDYSTGRFAWVFDRSALRVFADPLPATGAQGVWHINDGRLEGLAAIRRAEREGL